MQSVVRLTQLNLLVEVYMCLHPNDAEHSILARKATILFRERSTMGRRLLRLCFFVDNFSLNHETRTMSFLEVCKVMIISP